MKKLLFITLMCQAHLCLFAQTTVDTVDIRICYDARLRYTTKQTKKQIDEHWLDIGKNGVSKYYSYWKHTDQMLMDSVYSTGGDYEDFNRIRHERDIPRSRFEHTIFKNYQQPNQLTGISIPYPDGRFMFKEEMGQDWELAGDSIYQILGHPCRKATARYHGRTWTAFYATDIPIADGPWKLCGLPGLILYARDADKNYIFKCMALKPHVGEPITINKENTITVTPQRLEKILLEYHSNPIAALKARAGGDIVLRDAKGRQISQPTSEPVLMDHYEKD